MTNLTIKHIGLIPDGARRWAHRENTSLTNAYERSVEKITDLLELFFAKQILSGSIYLASTKNLDRRNHQELLSLFTAFEYLFGDLLPDICEKWEARVHIVGQLSGLSYEPSLMAVCKKTEIYQARSIYLVINYEPFEEMKQANISGKKFEIQKSLWMPERLNVVFRTGGAKTLSDFLPWQSGYAQLIFLDSLFNDTPVDLFQKIFNELLKSKVKYGE